MTTTGYGQDSGYWSHPLMFLFVAATQISGIALSDDSDDRDILLDAGADSVLSPHGLLGRRLAEKAVSSLGSELDTVALGGDLEVTELPVRHGSPLVGTRIRNSRIRKATGANIVGAWIDGELQLPPNPDAIIRDNTVLLVSGGHDALEKFSDATRRTRGLNVHERIIVVGQGEVGQAASEVVSDSGVDMLTLDTEDRQNVDIVGDVGSKSVLREAGVEDAGAIIIGLADDSKSLLATVVARSLNPDIEILVRVNDTDATRKALSAGADYVLSVPRVSARMVAGELRGEDVLAPASQIRLIRVPAMPFAGSTIAESGIYEQSGCRIIAVESEDGLERTVDPERELTGEERITLAGPDEAVREFLKRFDVSPVDTPEQP